jgi:uncharacterized protein with PIN domain
MAKILCKCGQILSNSTVPNEVVIHMFTDKEINEILVQDSVPAIELYRRSNEVWHCSNCDRLYFFDKNDKLEKIYRIEIG